MYYQQPQFFPNQGGCPTCGKCPTCGQYRPQPFPNPNPFYTLTPGTTQVFVDNAPYVFNAVSTGALPTFTMTSTNDLIDDDEDEDEGTDEEEI